MQELSEKQLSNLTISQLCEIRHELGHAIAHLNEDFRQNNSKADYTRKRKLQKYLNDVKAVLRQKTHLYQR